VILGRPLLFIVQWVIRNKGGGLNIITKPCGAWNHHMTCRALWDSSVGRALCDSSVVRALWDSGIAQAVEHYGIVGYLSG